MAMYNIGAPDWLRSLIWVREVVGPGSVDAPAVVFRGRRLWLREKLVLASTADHYGIFTTDEDEAPAATVTFDVGVDQRFKAFDHDDDTYAYYQKTLDGYASKKLLIIDLGSVATRWLYVKHAGANPYTNSIISVSEDGSTWVTASTASATTKTAAYYGSFRYVRWSMSNRDPSSQSCHAQLHSLEVYPSDDRNTYLFESVSEEFLTVVITAGGYWLYEVIYELELPEVG